MFVGIKFLSLSIALGLCLIEVLSQGKDVFAHIANDKDVMDRKADGEKPNIPVSAGISTRP